MTHWAYNRLKNTPVILVMIYRPLEMGFYFDYQIENKM